MARTIVTTSWDDGHVLDLKLAGLLQEYGLPATFYIAPDNREIPARERLTSDQIRDLGRRFEIGAHTLTHPVLTTIPAGEAEHEIAASKHRLEQILGHPVTTFCYPRGAYSEAHVGAARRAGFRYARTVRRYSLATGHPLEAATSLHAYRHFTDLPQIISAARFRPLRAWRYLTNWDQLAIALFEHALSTGGTFHLWGHSWEIEANRDWPRLERVLRHIAGHNDVRYVSNGELV
jgi:peptidoglycan/xylan/chitin deacetylase (PgdA/CDA1 family)